MRLSGIFIALCMALIAGSLGVILCLTFGFARLEAAVVAVAALTGLMLVNAVTTRPRDQGDLSDKIADLSRGTAKSPKLADGSRRAKPRWPSRATERTPPSSPFRPRSKSLELLSSNSPAPSPLMRTPSS